MYDIPKQARSRWLGFITVLSITRFHLVLQVPMILGPPVFGIVVHSQSQYSLKRKVIEMKFVIQRVEEASVRVDGEVVGAIGQGLLVLIGIEQEDTKEIADKYLKKLIGLRIFMDEEGKTNLSLADVGGELLLISQFTLCANCRKGNRPSFFKAGDPSMAEPLYEYMIAEAKKQVPVVERGVFGAIMKVSLINDGPFTVILEDL